MNPRLRPIILSGRPRWLLAGNPSAQFDFGGGHAWLNGHNYQGEAAFKSLFSTFSTPSCYVTDSAGVLHLAPANSIHGFYGSDRGQLIEEARTNLFLNSAAPVTQNITLAATGSYTLTVWGSGSATVAAGTATGTGFGAATAGTPVTFSITGTGSISVTVTGLPTFVQVELGVFGTSPIVTGGASATRAASSIIRTLGSEYNATEGAVYCSFFGNAAYPISGLGIVPVWLSDNSYNNRVSLASSTGSLAFNFDTTASATNTRAVLGNYTAGANQKAAGAWQISNNAGSLNGASAVTASPASLPSGLNRLDIGATHAATGYINGYVGQIALYRNRVGDSQLQALTA